MKNRVVWPGPKHENEMEISSSPTYMMSIAMLSMAAVICDLDLSISDIFRNLRGPILTGWRAAIGLWPVVWTLLV